MKLIIAGSRTIILPPNIITNFLENFKILDKITVLVSGGAKGVDMSAESWLTVCREIERNNVKLKRFPADWETHGKRAGMLRNAEMAKYADALLLIWDGESKGSANMRSLMLRADKPIYEVILKTVK